MKRIITIIIIISFSWAFQNGAVDLSANQDALVAESQWVDSIFHQLSLDEKIGQLMMIRAHSDLGADHIQSVKNQIEKYGVGGLCFFQGTAKKQIELTNQYQALSKVPLLVSMDAEWGLGMRLKKDGMSFPKQMTLGALQNNALLFDMGREIGKQLKRVGVHVNFAPVVDINNNPDNPVINTRSFGEDRYSVAEKSVIYAKGMEDAGIIACAKHFPGHGDTDVDSHLDLPLITHDRNRLDSIELFPFKVLAEESVGSVMVAHLNVPALDDTKDLPTTLSRKVVAELLREQLKFKGLIFTDAMEMKGVTKFFSNGKADAEALKAGNDVILLPERINNSIRMIKEYIGDGMIDSSMIDAKVKRVLKAKFRVGLNNYAPIDTTNLYKDLFNPQAQVLKAKLYEAAKTLIVDDKKQIPLTNLENLASLSIGAKRVTPFQEMLSNYATLNNLTSSKKIINRTNLLNKLAKKSTVIVSLHDLSDRSSKNFGIDSSSITFIRELSKQTKVILVVFGSPYSLQFFEDLPCIILGFHDDESSQIACAQGIVGAMTFSGRMPVTACSKFGVGSGISTQSLFKIQYGLPESVGLNSDTLRLIDSLANVAIETKATPGCQVLVARNGRIVYHKPFGYHTYAKKRKVEKTDVYDLASITKVAATTLSIMQLHEQGRLSIFEPIGKYIPELRGTDKENIIIEDILAHHARFKPWIPFYESTMAGTKKNPQPNKEIYGKKRKDKFRVPITGNLYMDVAYKDTVWQKIFESELYPNKFYRYSDLGFYILSRIVLNVSKKSLDRYVKQNYYRPMGLRTTTFKPYQSIPVSKIVPTEEDKYFRKEKIQGYVHDMGAAMLGGVSGHAGLFSNTGDLAILMQMLLNNGYYGGTQFLNYGTIRQFTMRYAGSTRRGIGFDMKERNPRKRQNTSELTSDLTFGHLGFTGTAVWCDPKYDLLFIFMSNRTYPDMNNYKLSKEDYRPNIHSVAYRAMNY